MAEAEKLFKINIVTPNGLIYSHRGSSVSMRAIDGDRQILYNHLPILTPLTIGEVRVQRGADVDHKVDHIAVSGGSSNLPTMWQRLLPTTQNARATLTSVGLKLPSSGPRRTSRKPRKSTTSSYWNGLKLLCGGL